MNGTGPAIVLQAPAASTQLWRFDWLSPIAIAVMLSAVMLLHASTRGTRVVPIASELCRAFRLALSLAQCVASVISCSVHSELPTFATKLTLLAPRLGMPHNAPSE